MAVHGLVSRKGVPGRPLKDPSERLTVRLRVNVTEGEADAFYRHVIRNHVTLSEELRRLLRAMIGEDLTGPSKT